MTGMELVQAAEAHAKVFLIRTVIESMTQLKLTFSPSLFVVIEQLVELYVVDTALKSLHDLLRVCDPYAPALIILPPLSDVSILFFTVHKCNRR